ncbi:hypothetical protein Sste5346_004397 [Sporothrix stenoceras]|uniref:Nicotinamide-nucleotide adenylyltransferase n=1 Tax=Sporothrix stenoceras TaxID=5173 RepID=A0ABR3ZB73_9PEZI
MPQPSASPPDPADKMAAAEVSFFSKALAGFAKSNSKFEVVCTISRRHVLPTPFPASNISPTPTTASSLPSPLVAPSRQRSQIHNLVILDSSFNPPTRAHMKLATSALVDVRSPLRQPDTPYLSTRLLLLLSVNNADKAPKPASFEQRLTLMLALARDTHVELAALDDPARPLLDVAIDIGLTSEPYFHNKSNAIAVSPFYARPSFPSASVDRPTPDQIFLLGYDTVIRIFDPKYYPKTESPTIPEGLPADATPMQIALTPLMRRARLRVTTRPDDQWGDEAAQQAWVADKVDALGGPTEQWASKIELGAGDSSTQGVSSTVAREASQAGDTEKLSQLVGPEVLARLATLKPYDA